MRRIYTHFCGGLGDVIVQFMENPYIVGIGALQKDPLYSKAVIVSHNLSAAELFRHDLRFDEIEVMPYTFENQSIENVMRAQGFVPSHSVAEINTHQPARFRYSSDDYDWLHYLHNGQGFPDFRFLLYQARGSNRAFDVDHMMNLDTLCEVAATHNTHVVKIGATYTHVTDETVLLQEPPVQCGASNFHDLTNIANPRLCCLLSRYCLGFVGAFSAYLWPCLWANKKCVSFIPHGLNNGHMIKARERKVCLLPILDPAEAAKQQDMLMYNIRTGLGW